MRLDKHHVMTAGIEKEVSELRPALRYSILQDEYSIPMIGQPIGSEVFQDISRVYLGCVAISCEERLLPEHSFSAFPIIIASTRTILSTPLWVPGCHLMSLFMGDGLSDSRDGGTTLGSSLSPPPSHSHHRLIEHRQRCGHNLSSWTHHHLQDIRSSASAPIPFGNCG